MKAAVVGVGGVGGFVAGLMAKNLPEVTVVARGARGEHIRVNGLTVHSDYKGEMVVFPKVVGNASELEPQDIIFVCVKNYSLETVCESLKNVVNKDTIIVPIMNGVDPGDRIRAMLPDCQVVDSLIYIVAFANPDFSVSQKQKFANLKIGVNDANEEQKAAVAKVSELLKAADIDHAVAEDIRCEIWRKYILNCAYNVSTARFNCPIGPIRDDAEHAKEYEALVNEAASVGLAQGVHLLQEHIDYVIWRFYYDHAYDASSSFQRDVAAGRITEIETFSGYIVKTAEKLGIDVPVSKKYYETLIAQGVK